MLPVLYSFRRCPYAMRARLALQYSSAYVQLREVELKNKPASLLAINSEATVPLLVLPNGEIIDESWQIMLWAIRQNDNQHWLGKNESLIPKIEMLIEMNDYSFKADLDHYKYADRYPEHPAEYYRELGEEFLQELEDVLAESEYLLGSDLTAADIALFPFVRQFVSVDKTWFESAAYPHLRHWLHSLLNSGLFEAAMQKFPVWQEGDPPQPFPVKAIQ